MDPSEKGPSILDLLKLERMWINEEVEELEALGKQRRKLSTKATPLQQQQQQQQTYSPISRSTNAKVSRHKSLGGKPQGPVIVLFQLLS
jgi:hypothetical protein